MDYKLHSEFTDKNGRVLKVMTTKFWRPNKEGTFIVVSDNGRFFDYRIK